MPNALPAAINRIAIFRALQLGDMLCSLPAIRALRSAYPDAEITLIGLPGLLEWARRYPQYINAFTSFPGIPGLPEQPFDLASLTAFLHREQEERYDLVIQMHGKGSITNPLVSMLGAKLTAGFYEEGEYCPDSRTYMPYPEGLPEIERHLRLMEFLNIEPAGRALEFPVLPDELAAASDLLQAQGGDVDNYVCIHPGARDARRWWAPRKFAQVADALAARGHTVVFTGTAQERETVERARALTSCASINLAGATSLGVLGALIARARVLISNDTGVSHLAAALGTPSVVIFVASDPARWAPLDRQLHQVVLAEDADNVDGVIINAERALSTAHVRTGLHG